MARSTYIYLLYQRIDARLIVIGAFTVKREMNDWIKTHIGPVYMYKRMKDGDPSYKSEFMKPEVYEECLKG